MHAIRLSSVGYMLYVICYMLYVICYMLYVICYMLHVTCYMLHVTCYMLYVICYMLYVICEMLYVICYMLYVFFARTFCDRFRRGPGATANYSTRRVRDLSPRWQAAGSRCIQPSRVLQDLVHSRRAGSRGDCVKRELEQRAGEGPLRGYGNDAAPAGHVGCTQGRADGSVRARPSIYIPRAVAGRRKPLSASGVRRPVRPRRVRQRKVAASLCVTAARRAWGRSTGPLREASLLRSRSRQRRSSEDVGCCGVR